MVVRHSCSTQCPHGRSCIAAGNVEEPEGRERLVDQNPVKPSISLAMEKIVVVDDFAINLPLLLEQCQSG
jgi:hypothetical protein